jgi:hypothetical protein
VRLENDGSQQANARPRLNRQPRRSDSATPRTSQQAEIPLRSESDHARPASRILDRGSVISDPRRGSAMSDERSAIDAVLYVASASPPTRAGLRSSAVTAARDRATST